MSSTLRDIRKGAGMVPILTALWLSSACKAELPQQLANDASGDFPCSPYADLLVAYSPPGTEGGSGLGERVLGAPNAESVELVTDASLTVSFVGLGSIKDFVGADIRVHGTLSDGAVVAAYVAGLDGEFVYTTGLAYEPENPDDPDAPRRIYIDMSQGTANAVVSVRLVGISGQATVDAFESLQDTCSN